MRQQVRNICQVAADLIQVRRHISSKSCFIKQIRIWDVLLAHKTRTAISSVYVSVAKAASLGELFHCILYFFDSEIDVRERRLSARRQS